MEYLSPLLAIFGTSGIFLWLLFYLLVLNPDKAEKLALMLSKFFLWTGRKTKKRNVAIRIEMKVASFINTINSEVEGLLPYNMKIKWVEPEIDKQSFIDEGDRVIVLLPYQENQDENLAKSTILYMKHAVIPEARPHIDMKLGRALDLMMTKKALFSFVESRSALNHFVDSVLRPEMKADSTLQNFCETIENIDERGLFTRVLLRELKELGLRRAGYTETGNTVHESTKFAEMLLEIAQKEQGQDVDLSFFGKNIKCAIILVARSNNISKGPSLYTNKIDEMLKKSVHFVYVFARGKKNIAFAKRVVQSSNSRFKELALIHKEAFPTRHPKGQIVEGYCAIFYNRKTV